MRYVENCRRAARPDASRQIARAIGDMLELIPEDAVLDIKQGTGQIDPASI
jgi:hypothetical protein